MNEHGRMHALDNLRAVMMWLGIVLHVAIIYTVTPGLFPFHDSRTTIGADLLLVFIHAFRMPVFFIMAGLFAALLAGREGYAGMWRNRLRRIALPFVLFWPPLFFATGLAFMLFVHVMARGTLGIDPSLLKPPPGAPPPPAASTMHLWFLYYLLIFCGVAALAGKLAPGGTRAGRIGTAAARLARRWWAPLVLALPAMLIAFDQPGGMAPNRTSFIPYPDELLHNGLFFAFGWLLYRHRDVLLAHYARHCWRYFGAGMLVLVAYLAVLSSFAQGAKPLPPGAGMGAAFTYACSGWLLNFAVIGLFVRYLDRPGARLAYLARSSYWVYLLHFPLAVAIGALLYRVDASAPVKMLLNIGATTAICLLSYQLLVRHTWIGRLLGGPARAAESKTMGTAAAVP